MKTLKSIKQALKIDKGQLTAQRIINGNIKTSKGWETFKLSEEIEEEIAQLVSITLGGRGKTQSQVFNAVSRRSPQHWGLSRIIFTNRPNPKDKRKNILSCSYAAGQDYPSELNEIRTAIKKM